MTGPDFNIMGPKKGNFVPSKYFDILVDRIGLTAIKMEWRWMDPGRGVRKGQIWLRLIRNGEIIADSRYDLELWYWRELHCWQIFTLLRWFLYWKMS